MITQMLTVLSQPWIDLAKCVAAFNWEPLLWGASPFGELYMTLKTLCTLVLGS